MKKPPRCKGSVGRTRRSDKSRCLVWLREWQQLDWACTAVELALDVAQALLLKGGSHSNFHDVSHVVLPSGTWKTRAWLAPPSGHLAGRPSQSQLGRGKAASK